MYFIKNNIDTFSDVFLRAINKYQHFLMMLNTFWSFLIFKGDKKIFEKFIDRPMSSNRPMAILPNILKVTMMHKYIRLSVYLYIIYIYIYIYIYKYVYIYMYIYIYIYIYKYKNKVQVLPCQLSQVKCSMLQTEQIYL